MNKNQELIKLEIEKLKEEKADSKFAFKLMQGLHTPILAIITAIFIPFIIKTYDNLQVLIYMSLSYLLIV